MQTLIKYLYILLSTGYLNIRIQLKMRKNYIKKILKENPKLSSGRINYDFYNKRINKNIKLIKNFLIKQKNKI